jgi:hypothetical protein
MDYIPPATPSIILPVLLGLGLSPRVFFSDLLSGGLVAVCVIILIILYLRQPKSVLVHLPEEIAWSYLMAENSIPKWKKRGTEDMGNNHHLLHPHPR